MKSSEKYKNKPKEKFRRSVSRPKRKNSAPTGKPKLKRQKFNKLKNWPAKKSKRKKGNLP
jgi:hypothetical protein